MGLNLLMLVNHFEYFIHEMISGKITYSLFCVFVNHF